MDANNTRYHLLHGERDWIPVLVNQSSAAVWWDRERKSISLAPVVEQLNELEQGALLEQARRRGAAFDHYGNIYWINEARDGIDYQPATTPLQNGRFWHVDELKRASQADRGHGDFKPAPATATMRLPSLSGLAVTTHEYLVVGTVQPAGILVFDLHAGGPPDWLLWPEAIPVLPVDIACTPDGGVCILDRNAGTGAARVWRLDQHFRVLDSNDEALYLNGTLNNDFHAVDSAEAEPCTDNTFVTGIGLDIGSPVLASDPVAIEALADNAFIILSTPDDGAPSTVHYFKQNVLRDSVTLDDQATGAVMADAAIVGHDFAFLPDPAGASATVGGTLHVAATTATQSFEFALRASDTELTLVMQPRLLPMRAYGGRALIASGTTAYYDFTEPKRKTTRWLPLTEQPRPRFQSEAEVVGIIRDGGEPDCVWHRIIMDACIPGGTRVLIETRAANDEQSLQELPWQPEPEPCLRGDGSELPLHQPFDDIETQPDTIGSWDLLLQNAVGRYLELRLTLQGTRRSTPRIRSLRLYYPRYSYLDRYLPAVYRDDRVSASFLDRFLANVEGLFTALEDRIANAQILFDTRSTPAEFLDWLGGWLGAFMDPAWDDNRKRLFIDHAFLLFRWRGTPLGLWAIIKLGISECPDAGLFDSLKQSTPISEAALGGRDVRIVENFLTRRFPGIHLGDADQTTALVFDGSKTPWEPAMGAGVLHQKYQRYVCSLYQAEQALTALNEAWDENFSRFEEIVFPPLTPEHETQKHDWQIFTRDHLGFTYAQVSGDDLPLYQEFLARRYQQIARLNAAHGLSGDFALTDFSEIVLPEALPRNTTALTDWIEFVSMVLPIKDQAHRFTVLLPTVLGELPAAMERRKAQVEEIVKREKPAHTDFEVKFFWALFQIGSARLGLDTGLGEGSRFVAMVLGANFLGQSFLAESHPWSVADRSVVGRERLGTYK